MSTGFRDVKCLSPNPTPIFLDCKILDYMRCERCEAAVTRQTLRPLRGTDGYLSLYRQQDLCI